ncbi:hypothetical protein L218DRAFT_101068 [Marasmius fiardii PR-910]|nr:hypothetical protein L218DRAFT_101068 [Marasmius fiardii PR-910]
MLKSYQACIDLEKGVLRIQGREVRFLSEHELPESARQEAVGAAPGGPLDVPGGRAPVPTSTSRPTLGSSSSGSGSASAGRNQPSSLPGGGNLGGLPGAATQRPSNISTTTASGSRHPEEHIRMIMDLGAVTREVAISTLDAAGGNVDVAASLLF